MKVFAFSRCARASCSEQQSGMSTLDRSYRRFGAWRACHAFTLAVYKVTRSWPAEEKFGLTSQLRRACVSAEANIAEGSAKRGPAEFARYLDIAHGSLSEVECLLEVARDLGFLPASDWAQISGPRLEAARQTAGLLAAMRLRLKNPRPPAALPP